MSTRINVDYFNERNEKHSFNFYAFSSYALLHLSDNNQSTT